MKHSNNFKDLSRQNVPLLFCFGVFFFAQALYSYLGLGYGKSFWPAITQVGTDPSVLSLFKENFFQSLFYYHLLPPGYISYAYGFTILFPPDGQVGIYCLHTFLGLWAVGSLYRIQEKLNINTILSVSLITLYVISPAYNLYQSMGWYDFPTASLLIISTWRIIKLTETPNFKNGFIFFFTIALICSVRSMYHITLYFFPLIVVSLLVFRKHYKLVFLSALIPFAIIFAMYFKNYLLYNTFSVNSYAGENISMITSQWNFPLKWRYDGIKKGYFSDLMLCRQSPDGLHTIPPNFAYSGYDCWKTVAQKYRNAYIEKLGKEYKNVPLLQPIKGQIFLHRSGLGNIGVDLEFAKNSVQALIHYPTVYLTNIRETWRLYFCDSSGYFYDNMGNVRNLPTWLPYTLPVKPLYSLIIMLPFLMFFGASLLLLSISDTTKLSALYLSASTLIMYSYIKTLADWATQYKIIGRQLSLMGLMIFALLSVRIYKYLRYKTIFINSSLNAVQRVGILFLLCNIAYSSFIMTMFAGNEQQRYRFYVTGLFVILFALFLQIIGSRLLGLVKRRDI